MAATPIKTTGKQMEYIYPRAHLLGLPPELRNKIYRDAVVQNQPINITLEGSPHRGHFTITPPLTTVNRQLRHETRPIFLEENTFAIVDPCILNYASEQPFRTFENLFKSVELQRVQVSLVTSVVVANRGRFDVEAKFTVVKSESGYLEVRDAEYLGCQSGMVGLVLLVTGMILSRRVEVCGCRIAALAEKVGPCKGGIIKFLGELRQVMSDGSAWSLGDGWYVHKADMCDSCSAIKF